MPISDVKSFLEQQKLKKLEDKWMPWMHHKMMMEYGYIPFEEFKNLPLPTLWLLYEQLHNEWNERKREQDKIKDKSRLRKR